jgi:hypothetical protein
MSAQPPSNQIIRAFVSATTTATAEVDDEDLDLRL